MRETKRCTRCRRRLPIDAFAIRRASPDGRQNYCRACASEWARLHRPRKLKDSPDVGPGEKWCRRCQSAKLLSDFGAHRTTTDRKQTYCKQCFADIYRERRQREGHVVRPADIPDGHKFCRGCQRVLPFTEWAARISTKDGLAFQCRTCLSVKDRAKHLQRKYGLSLADVDAMLRMQHGICAICQTLPAVHVDHDHGTGNVRGLLCFRCNAALGQFGDEAFVLRRAARYLDRGGIRGSSDHPTGAQAGPLGLHGGSPLERALRARLAGADFGTAS
jgi:hypothetical protein